MAIDKRILDTCCGGKMFYFDKNDSRVLFCDIRQEEEVLCDGRTLRIDPNIVADFRKLPFDDNQFDLVVFDPPHRTDIGEKSWMAKKYGRLPKEWKKYIKDGMREAWRVLTLGGTMIFKWSENEIKISRLKDVFPAKPVLGTRNNYTTIFLVFYKERNI